ncbi:signal peptidase II [Floccifex sp.]|uniref:signal peptidase II n=1 Tax=Floccifex sp. TaxID=2815810 RepID=UPI002A761699|nr:signal peptidase II [Floccifex sp.]MDD7281587.1 signal peptidase II [Erysipelotrichaceae bacterium]MDY2958170.1 signal peptidase II [Floccifex sp.]
MKKKWILAIVLSLCLIGLDQVSKYWITNTISLSEKINLIPNLLYITYCQNTGAAFSMMEGFGKIFFGIITIVALVFIFYMFKDSQDRVSILGYVMVFSGAIGNFIDRMVFNYVRDFIGVYIGSYAFPIFNVADICITVGFAVILIVMVYQEVEEKRRWKKELSK